MRNITKKIILSTVIFLSVMGFVNRVNATEASLYISPTSLTKNTGDTFNISIGFNALSNKVCAVEGTLVLNNLSCQSIAVASDVIAQSSPTCSNLHFLIGIPNCTTLDKNIISISVKSGSVGTSSINVTSVDIIGEGSSAGSTSASGNYTINSIPVVKSQSETVVQKAVVQKEIEETKQTENQIVKNDSEVVLNVVDETINQPAGLVEAKVSKGIFGWIWSNIVWIIILILSNATTYIICRINYKINKR